MSLTLKIVIAWWLINIAVIVWMIALSHFRGGVDES